MITRVPSASVSFQLGDVRDGGVTTSERASERGFARRVVAAFDARLSGFVCARELAVFDGDAAVAERLRELAADGREIRVAIDLLRSATSACARRSLVDLIQVTRAEERSLGPLN